MHPVCVAYPDSKSLAYILEAEKNPAIILAISLTISLTMGGRRAKKRGITVWLEARKEYAKTK